LAAKNWTGLGIIDKQGKAIIDFQFNAPPVIGKYSGFYSWPGFKENRAIIFLYDKTNNKPGIGYIDKKGNRINNISYDYDSEYFFDGKAKVVINQKYGIIDVNGDYIIEPIYDDMGVMLSSLIAVKSGSLYGYMDKSFNIKIDFLYNYAESFNSDLGLVGREINGKMKYGYINPENKIVIPIKYEKAFSFDNDGYALVKENGKYGLINTSGTYTIIPGESVNFGNPGLVGYNGMLRFSDYIIEDIIIYYDNSAESGFESDKAGYMRTDGTVLTGPVFFNAFLFENGVAKVQTGDDYRKLNTGYINTDGKYIWEPTR